MARNRQQWADRPSLAAGLAMSSDPCFKLKRRRLLQGMLCAGAAAALPFAPAAANDGVLTRPIPRSGEQIPVLGLGSWITFNVGDDVEAMDECAEVVRAFFAAGGRMIDSSPMYGSSQDTIGHALRKLGRQNDVFAADKVWTGDGEDGPEQIETSRRRWSVPAFSLLQVHNLLAWEAHLDTLFALRAAGKLRYVGITTSEGRRHAEFERIMRSQPLDFVQLTYNLLDREAEQRLLPLAAERGIAVICNRPFREGALIDDLQGKPLPGWAAEIGCRSWAQCLLKFIIGHPAVTCAIPATSRVDHVVENMAAARGVLPDQRLRQRMIDDVEAL